MYSNSNLEESTSNSCAVKSNMSQATQGKGYGCVKVDVSVLESGCRYKTFVIHETTTSKELILRTLVKYKRSNEDQHLYFLTVGINKEPDDPCQLQSVTEDACPLTLLSSQSGSQKGFCLRMRPGVHVKVYGGILMPEAPYKTCYISLLSTCSDLIELVFKRYNTQEDPSDFCLHEVSSKYKSSRPLSDNDLPYTIQMSWGNDDESYSFRLRRRTTLKDSVLIKSDRMTSTEKNDKTRDKKTQPKDGMSIAGKSEDQSPQIFQEAQNGVQTACGDHNDTAKMNLGTSDQTEFLATDTKMNTDESLLNCKTTGKILRQDGYYREDSETPTNSIQGMSVLARRSYELTHSDVKPLLRPSKMKISASLPCCSGSLPHNGARNKSFMEDARNGSRISIDTRRSAWKYQDDFHREVTMADSRHANSRSRIFHSSDDSIAECDRSFRPLPMTDQTFLAQHSTTGEYGSCPQAQREKVRRKPSQLSLCDERYHYDKRRSYGQLPLERVCSNVRGVPQYEARSARRGSLLPYHEHHMQKIRQPDQLQVPPKYSKEEHGKSPHHRRFSSPDVAIHKKTQRRMSLPAMAPQKLNPEAARFVQPYVPLHEFVGPSESEEESEPELQQQSAIPAGENKGILRPLFDDIRRSIADILLSRVRKSTKPPTTVLIQQRNADDDRVQEGNKVGWTSATDHNSVQGAMATTHEPQVGPKTQQSQHNTLRERKSATTVNEHVQGLPRPMPTHGLFDLLDGCTITHVNMFGGYSQKMMRWGITLSQTVPVAGRSHGPSESPLGIVVDPPLLVRVRHIAPNSISTDSRLRKGDIIMEVNHQIVLGATLNAVRMLIDSAVGHLLLVVAREPPADYSSSDSMVDVIEYEEPFGEPIKI